MKKLSIEKVIAEILKFYKAVILAIVYAGSFSYAFRIFVHASSETSFYLFTLVVFFGFVGVALNYLFYRMSSKNYHSWNQKGFKDFPFEMKIMLTPFFPPVSTFFMSSALFVYGASFFSEYFQEMWSVTPSSLSETLEGFLTTFLFMFVIFVISFGSMSVLSYFFARRFKSMSSGKYLILVLLYLLIIFGSGALYWFLHDNKLLISIFSTSIYFLIGFIPFHWVYYIFILPFKNKTNL